MKDWTEKENKLTRDFEFNDFTEALAFVNTVAKIAEEMNHHPDILMHSYNKVTISTSTHSKGAITNKDHELAGNIDNSSKV